MNKITLLILALFMGVNLSFAQSRTVEGVVTDDSGVLLPGVTVVVKGTTSGTVTDVNGKYTLKVDSDASMLVFSFVGMQTQELSITGKVLNVKLKTEAVDVDAVVVTAMGMTKSKKAIGYASDEVSGDDISALDVANPMSALQGKVAGLQIEAAPSPGASQNVMIRGASSFGNSQPLYVVDGIPIVNLRNSSGDALNSTADLGTGINAINPDNIKEMTVLKGAAATALYGSRAANGVILITTKSGENTEGKMKITYDGSIGYARVGRIPQVQKTFGQGWGGLSGGSNLAENGNWGAAYDDQDRVWGNVIDGSQMIKPYSFLEDRVRDFYEMGLTYKNAISASGGNANTQYLLALSQTSQDGVIPTDHDTYNRYTITTNASHRAGKLTASSQVNFSYEKTNSVPSGQGASFTRSIWEVPNDISLVDLEDYNNKFNNLDNYFTPYGLNPYWVINNNQVEQIKTKVFGKFELAYDITNDLKVMYRFSGDTENSTVESKMAKVTFSEGSPNEGSSTESPGSYGQQRIMRYEVNHDFQFMYNKNLSEKWTLDALLGVNFNDRGLNRLAAQIQSLDVDGTYNFSNTTGYALVDASNTRVTHRRLAGVFGSVDLGYNDYLFFNLTARNDWSSTLPIKNNSFFYPGVTGSFLISDFVEKQGGNMGKVSFLKARLSYGWTGNDADVYKVYPVYTAGLIDFPGYSGIDDLFFPVGGINAYELSNTLGNPNLKPEITKEIEGGLDVRLFNNRIGFDVSVYSRLTEGLIAQQPLDPSTGFTSQTTNLCDLRNRGVELGIDFTPIKTNNFTWDVRYTFSTNKSRVQGIGEDEVSLGGFSGTTIVAKEGEEIGKFKTTIPQTVILDSNGKIAQTGVEKVVVDGSGNVMQSADLVVVDRDVNEDWQMGLTSTFKYKAFTLGATFDMHYGGYMYSNTKDYLSWTGASIESTLNGRQPFLVPNSVVDNGDGTYSENTTPALYGNAHNFYANYGGMESGLYNIIDRSYLKLRNVSLSYRLPESMMKKWKLSNFTVSFVASNILLWTPADNPFIDPETTSFGNDIEGRFGEFMANPTNQTYTLGVSFGI
ncbi:MAG: SusC/RagA family TonB-linked outer membrane protein [Mangrovibacterium sp.]